jgi:hypothetical protein
MVQVLAGRMKVCSCGQGDATGRQQGCQRQRHHVLITRATRSAHKCMLWTIQHLPLPMRGPPQGNNYNIDGLTLIEDARTLAVLSAAWCAMLARSVCAIMLRLYGSMVSCCSCMNRGMTAQHPRSHACLLDRLHDACCIYLVCVRAVRYTVLMFIAWPVQPSSLPSAEVHALMLACGHAS